MHLIKRKNIRNSYFRFLLYITFAFLKFYGWFNVANTSVSASRKKKTVEGNQWSSQPLIGRWTTRLDRKQELNVLYQVRVFGPIAKPRYLPWPLISGNIFDIFSETTEQNLTTLDRNQDLDVPYPVVFFGLIEKRWPPWPLIGWDTFDFSSEWNLMKLARKQELNFSESDATWQDKKLELNFLNQVRFSGRSEKRDGRHLAVLISDWLKHVWFLIWTDLDEIEARTKCPLPSLCFSGQSENKEATQASDSLWQFRLLWNCWTKRSITGSKKSMFSTKFVFFRPLGKPRWPSHCLIDLEIFYSYEQNSTKLDIKEDLNVLYQVLFSANLSTRWHCVLWCTIWGSFGPLFDGTWHSNKTGNTFLFLSSCGTCKHTIIDRWMIFKSLLYQQ